MTKQQVVYQSRQILQPIIVSHKQNTFRNEYYRIHFLLSSRLDDDRADGGSMYICICTWSTSMLCEQEQGVICNMMLSYNNDDEFEYVKV
jgi:hypothetical protein